MPYQVDLDFGGEWDEASAYEMVEAWVREKVPGRHSLTWTIVDEHGPAGGAPVVRFQSPYETWVLDVVRAYAPLEGDDDPYDQAYLLTLVEQVRA